MVVRSGPGRAGRRRRPCRGIGRDVVGHHYDDNHRHHDDHHNHHNHDYDHHHHGSAVRGLGGPGDLRPAVGRRRGGPAHVPGQPDPHLLRPGPGAVVAGGGVAVPRRRPAVLDVDDRRRAPPVVRHRLDGPARHLRAGRPHLGGGGGLQRQRPLPRRRHRRAPAGGLRHRRHHQGVGDRRPRRLPAGVRGQPGQPLPGGRLRRRAASGAVVAGRLRPRSDHVERRLGQLGHGGGRPPVHRRRELPVPHRRARPGATATTAW